MSPGDAFEHRTMTMWEWNWQPHVREKDTKRRLRYFIGANVPAASARTFTLVLRCSPDTDWKHLVAPYKSMFDAWAGDQRAYSQHDARPLIQSVVNSAVQYITDSNPYGLHSGRRIDTADGVASFAATTIGNSAALQGVGVILWGQGGSDPRGAMYRPDFDVVPPEMAENLPRLAQQLTGHGLKLGLTARPAEIAQRADFERDLTTWLAPTPNNLRVLNRRFQRAHDWGVRLYYLDTFGNRIDDVAIMRSIRSVIGRDVQTYAEHGSDVILPWSGLYTEMLWDPATKQYGFAFLSMERIAFFRWLCPEVPIISRINFGNPWEAPDPAVDPPATFLLKHRITPLFCDYHVSHHPEQAEQFGELVRQYIDEDGRWKDDPREGPGS